MIRKGSRLGPRKPDNDASPNVFRKHRGIGNKEFLRTTKVDFDEILKTRMDELSKELRDAPMIEQLRKDAKEKGEKNTNFKHIWHNFRKNVLVDEQPRLPWIGASRDNEKSQPLYEGLRDVWRKYGIGMLDERIKYAFYDQVTGSRFTEREIRNQKALADLRYPAEWFPATRSLHRTIHVHVGPTNSGKTYHALQRLEKAETGCYAGPLRLLAHEVYSRMNAKGRPCALVTGEERRNPTGALNVGNPSLTACTVEMMPLNKELDVAVIDEIQMIGNPERGWAWTQALMGVRAKEVHLCGEERTVPLIRELCASVGDKVEIHRYERLSPLKLADESMNGDLKKLRKGDCIVSFSVMGIHALRKQIEQQTGRKVATVYGSLPPETRAQQARLFNDPDNEYDYLVASDAVGMGLNLAIKRMIFETSSKFDGVQRRTLDIADIKQIGGRAGRYRTAQFNAGASAETQDLAAAKGDSPVEVNVATTAKEAEAESVGLVTTLESFDFPIVAAAMAAEPEPLRTAGLFPPGAIIERFASYFPPGTPFSYILMRLHELSQMHSRFHLCGLKDQTRLADLIEPVRGLTVNDRNVICSAPYSKSDDMFKTLMPAFARCIAEQSGGSIIEIKELPLETLEAEVSGTREYLKALESLHKGIVAYLWLSYRFAGIFSTRQLAFHVKGMVEERIEEVLGKFSFSETQRRKQAAKREKEMKEAMEMEAAMASLEMSEGGRQKGGASEVASEGDAEAEDVKEGGLADQEAERGSMIAGGDHFGGEEDIAIEDPAVSELVIEEPEEKQPTLSFAEWRAQQTRGESQASDEDAPTIQSAVREGEERAAEAIREGEIERVGEERPSVADVDPDVGALDVAPDESAMSPEQDAANLEAGFTPETEMADDERPAVSESQAEPPQTDEPRTEPEQADEAEAVYDSKKSQQATGRREGTPLAYAAVEQVAHLNVNAAERGESQSASRP